MRHHRLRRNKAFSGAPGRSFDWKDCCPQSSSVFAPAHKILTPHPTLVSNCEYRRQYLLTIRLSMLRKNMTALSFSVLYCIVICTYIVFCIGPFVVVAHSSCWIVHDVAMFSVADHGKTTRNNFLSESFDGIATFRARNDLCEQLCRTRELFGVIVPTRRAFRLRGSYKFLSPPWL